jgi:hypothetical protein
MFANVMKNSLLLSNYPIQVYLALGTSALRRSAHTDTKIFSEFVSLYIHDALYALCVAQYIILRTAFITRALLSTPPPFLQAFQSC